MKYRKSPLQIEKDRTIRELHTNDDISSVIARTPFPKDAVVSLERAVKGRLVWPWSDEYDQARRDFNDLYPAFPLLIVFAAGYLDVRQALAFAQMFKLQTTIRSGRHSFCDFSVCNGMVIDMSQLNNVYVNPAGNTAVIETGCTFEKIYPAVEAYGLHMPGGGCPTVGIGGYMQGGGYSLTSRMYGINCDTVLECTVMLADGRIVRANAGQNEDLFWAIRGGTGGNFGVLLNIRYQLYPMGTICGTQIKWPIEGNVATAAEVLYTLQEIYLKPNAYPELGLEVILTSDADDNNRKKIFFCATWIGDSQLFEQALQPVLSVGLPENVVIKNGHYSDMNQYALENAPAIPPDVKGYARSAIIEKPLQKADWEAILNYFLTAPNQYAMVDMECYGGQINNVPVAFNAFVHRRAKLDFFCLVFFNKATNDQQQCKEWQAKFYQFMSAYSNGHSYQNYPNRDQTDFRWAFWGEYYNQLVDVKKKYDPLNFFHYLQSIGPDTLNDTSQTILFEKKEIVYEPY